MTNPKNESYFSDVADLRAENEKLRAEVERLRGEAPQADGELQALLDDYRRQWQEFGGPAFRLVEALARRAGAR